MIAPEKYSWMTSETVLERECHPYIWAYESDYNSHVSAWRRSETGFATKIDVGGTIPIYGLQPHERISDVIGHRGGDVMWRRDADIDEAYRHTEWVTSHAISQLSNAVLAFNVAQHNKPQASWLGAGLLQMGALLGRGHVK
jgi:hypothetical protein